MSLTVLDPHTALLVVDVQKGLAAYPLARPLAEVAQRAGALAAAFRAARQPVVLINVAGRPPGRCAQAPGGSGLFPPEFTAFMPALGQVPGDLVATKTSWGAFTTTGLEATLKARGVTQVVVAGVATSIGVESTAREAHGLGFNVTLACDAMTDLSFEAHDYAVRNIFPRLGETGTMDEIIARLPRGG